MISGGSRRSTFSPAGTVSRPRAMQLGADVGVRGAAAQAEQQALAANLLNHAREGGGQALDLGRAAASPCARTCVEKALLEHHVEHAVGDGAGERIAAEGGAVRAGRHAGGGARGRQARADREAAAQALGQRHDVGRHPGPFVGEQPAGPAHAALHLVEDQQQVVLVAELPQLLEEARRRRVRMPPSPWIGSIRTAAVCSPIAASTLARSPSGT